MEVTVEASPGASEEVNSSVVAPQQQLKQQQHQQQLKQHPAARIKSSSWRMASFPDEVLEHVLKFITRCKDRNSVSLVCKAWYKAEGWCRRSVFIGNCYAVSPEIVAGRFPRLTSVTLKGKPRFADFNLVPRDWGAHVYPWIHFFVHTYPWLEELRLKRMTVSDESLLLIARSLPNFKALVLTNCDGFSTDGVAYIASCCRNLTELDMQECEVEDRGGEWLSRFPATCTTLVSLNFSCLESEVKFEDLEQLVGRCTGLKKLKLNKGVTLEFLHRLLLRAPQLTELGTGTYSQVQNWSQYLELRTALGNCRDLRALSGFWMLEPVFVPLIYPLSKNILSLNLSYATIRAPEFIKLIIHCRSLENLWVLDSVEDKGLEAVAAHCGALRELRVFPADATEAVAGGGDGIGGGAAAAGGGGVTEAGLVAVSAGCPRLSSVLYFCRQCTNAAVAAVAANCPAMRAFRLCIMVPRQRDYLTGEAMDAGFAAIVRRCRQLRRLAVSGELTDGAFAAIGRHASRLETLSVAFAGGGCSDAGLTAVLTGCARLRKLEIRDSAFGDGALLAGLPRYTASMRFLWMSACRISLAAARRLAAAARPLLNVELIRDDAPCACCSSRSGGGGNTHCLSSSSSSGGDRVKQRTRRKQQQRSRMMSGIAEEDEGGGAGYEEEDGCEEEEGYEDEEEGRQLVDKLYVYRTVSGPRRDSPCWVTTL